MQFVSNILKLEYFLAFTIVQVATGIIIHISPSLPEVSKTVTISCYSTETSRTWYHSGLYKAACNSQRCLPNDDPQRGYTFTADKDKAEVTISSLNITRDEGLWMCSSGINQSISLNVSSFPSGLSFSQGGATEIDLEESQTILECKTDGCTYPAPTINWYFKDIAPSTTRNFYKDTGTNVSNGSCPTPEKLYNSILVLPHLTTWQDNIDKNVTLSCGIEYSNVSRNVYSKDSRQIRFAVRVTEAVIQQDNQNITDILNITVGFPVTFTCKTGTSRPPATIIWYLGDETKGNGTILNYTPSAADHNGIFYCQVYNTDQSKKIDSKKARLYVRVPIDSVLLQNGTALTLNEGQMAVLVCETGGCRPSADIYWMKSGTNITGPFTGVSKINVGNDLFISMGTLNYTGQRGDNGKTLTCGAYNGLGTGRISRSLTFTIYYPPEGPPELEGQVNGSNFIVIENTPKSMTCRIIGGNPLANLSWICVGHIGTANKSEQTVTSTIVFAVGRSAQNQRCTCRASHPADINKDVFVLLQVHYAANITKFFPRANVSEILENHTFELYCQVDSNPYAVISILFGDILKSMTRASNELIHNGTAGCLDTGKYICSATNSVMNGAIVSAEVNLYVQCSPRLDYRKNTSTVYHRVLNDNVILEVNVIAYPEPTDIMWYHRGDKTDKWQQVPNQPASSSGLNSRITVHLGSQAEFGDYLVNMTNSFGIYDLFFQVIQEEVEQVSSRIQETSPGNPVVPVAAGVGSVAVVAVICIILVIIVIRRKRLRHDGLEENKTYQSSGTTSSSDGVTGAEFALVVQTFPNVHDRGNLYAQVDRNKKISKKGVSRPKKKQEEILEGEIYENATLKEKSSNPEEVYENPGAAASTVSMVTRDGLLYADLVLDSPTTKNDKPVIRGIENVTEYAEIAYGKRGQPLPDNDDGKENENKKADE